ncbi:MAG: hypothetical protein WCT46_03765 [Candidatus Gracilibacteria bacterium]
MGEERDGDDAEEEFFAGLYPKLFRKGFSFGDGPTCLVREMSDPELNHTFLESLSQEVSVPDEVNALEAVQRIAAEMGLDCSFDSENSVREAIDSFPPNTRAILVMCLGLGGPIEWVTCDVPWADPKKMPNTIAQNILWISGDPDTYTCEGTSYTFFQKFVSRSAIGLERDVELVMEELNDSCLPLVLQVSFRGISPRDEKAVFEMHRRFIKAIFYSLGSFHVDRSGRDLMLLLPLRDYLRSYENEYPDDETLFDRIAWLIKHLDETEMGEKGNSRFTCGVKLLAPQGVVSRRRDSQSSVGILCKHKCMLLPQNSPPDIRRVASFFEIMSEQVEAAFKGLFSVRKFN